MSRCFVLGVVSISLGLLTLGFSPRADAGQVYDLASDWSDSTNPNGVWQYGTMSPSLGFTPFPIHVNDYINVGSPAFTGNQPAWTDTVDTGSNGSPQGLAKSVGNSLFDFPSGLVGGHTPASSDYLAVKWTATAAGTIDLSGSVWMWRDLGRHEALSLFVNNSALIGGVAIPVRSTGVNSSNPFTLAQAIVAGGGGAGSLLDIPVTSGETVILAARRIDAEDFVGMNFTINFTAASVPEPSSLVLMSASTAFGAIWLLRCRRRQKQGRS
jgi:hypothetical protein